MISNVEARNNVESVEPRFTAASGLNGKLR